jgi:phosphoglycerate dehydrogenase-like enzyme
MYPVVFPHPADRGLAAELAALRRHGLQVRIVAPGDRRGLREALADAVLLWWRAREPVTRALLAEAPRLRLVQVLGPGSEAVDLVAVARARGIAVCAAPGADVPAIVEMVLALMLACLRHLPALDRATRAGAGWWPSSAAGEPPLGELGGRTVGLVGYGAVPARLAPVLKALGSTVLYWHPQREPGAEASFVPLRELMESADLVSLHLPLTPETERLVDAAALALMKPGAVLVNTADGGLVDEAALVDALTSGPSRRRGPGRVCHRARAPGPSAARPRQCGAEPACGWADVRGAAPRPRGGGRERPPAARRPAAAAPGRLTGCGNSG